MKIAILGAGNAGCALAADLTIKNHEITLIKTSNFMHNENFEYILKNNGKIILHDEQKENTAYIDEVTKDLSKIKDKELIIIHIQTNYHEELIKKIIPYLKNDQMILLNPGYLSTAYMLKHLKKVNPILIEAESSFLDCRILKPGYIKVSFRNVRNPLGVFPCDKTDYVKNKLKNLNIPFEYISTIEAALHNPNLIVHTVGGVMSIPQIEKTKGAYCMYHDVYTPSVWNILEKLDNEKMNITEKLGFGRLSYVEACKYRNTLDIKKDAKEVFFEYANSSNVVKGPSKVDSRYITEDVSQGLVMLESLGEYLNVQTTVCTSFIEIASAALVKDLRKNGRTLKKLGENNFKKIINDSKHKFLCE